MSPYRCITAAVLLAIAGSTQAQTGGSATQSSSARVARQVESTCPTFSARLVDRPEIKAILAQRPVDIGVVCACTQKSFVADTRLRAALEVDEHTFAERMADERMRAYMTLRLMTSVLACMAPELEKSLAAISPVR